MARFFVFLVVVGGTVLAMNSTKPTQVDFYEELQRRADAIQASEQNAFVEMRGGHPLDTMVKAQSPTQLLNQTHLDDYFVVNVFTTAYDTPGYGTRQVQTIALLSTFFSHRIYEAYEGEQE